MVLQASYYCLLCPVLTACNSFQLFRGEPERRVLHRPRGQRLLPRHHLGAVAGRLLAPGDPHCEGITPPDPDPDHVQETSMMIRPAAFSGRGDSEGVARPLDP